MFKIKQQEKRVEKFYTAGSKRLEHNGNETIHINEGFISFGYWESGDDYTAAAKRLLRYFINNSRVKKADRILNVACGYGSETFAYFEKFRPREIIGLDITKVHIDYANEKAKKKKLSKKIKFVHGSAVNLSGFPDSHFSHIFGIEGPAHFNTRKRFFNSANRVLKSEGELMLTDIILGKNYCKWHPVQKMLLCLGARGWVVPMENAVNEKEYKEQLKRAGFDIIFFKKIGDKVFPGYAKSFISDPERCKDKKLGFFKSLGFQIIGRFLGYAYKKGWIEYVYFKAKKSGTPDSD